MTRHLRNFVKAALVWCMSVSLAVSAGTIKIAGSTSAYPVVNAIAFAYMEKNDSVDVEISATGSGVGLQQLIDNKIDIALSSRFALNEELQQAASKGIYLVPFRIAYDYILPVVNPKNPLKNLTTDQLKAIYAGNLTNWKQLGGKDSPIQVVSRENTSGTYSLWNEKILQQENLTNKATTVQSNLEMVSAVSRNSNAIGYIGQGYLNSYLKPISINGEFGTRKQVRDGDYFLNRTLFLFTRGWPEGEIIKFINFITSSDTGRQSVQKAGLIPVN